MKNHCQICKRALNVKDDPSTEDCGGDCLRCMAEAGDPSAILVMREKGLPFENYDTDLDDET